MSRGSDYDRIVASLIEGHYFLKGPVKDESRAYKSYLYAFEAGKRINDTLLICEALKGILGYQVFQNREEETFYEYLSVHRIYSYDRLEEIYNEYYRLRAITQFDYAKNEIAKIDRGTWMRLIDECARSKFYRLETSLRAMFAIYLEIHERDFKAAQEIYESSIISASKVDKSTFEKIQFSALSNIGAMYLEEEDYQRALDFLNRASASTDMPQRPFNLILLYNWLTKIHYNLGAVDSAYFYLKKAYDTSAKYELDQHAIAVNEIQEKYQNETLKVDLMEKDLQRNRYFLLAWIFGGLFVIGSLIYFFYARLSRLRSINLQQNLQSLEKESLLRAVNAKIDGEEEERKRVASVLHDNIATHLAASRLHLKVMKKGVTLDAASLEKADDLIGEVSTKVRQLSHELYPPALYQLGLMQAIESLCEKYTSPHLRFEISSNGVVGILTKEQEIRLYFIIQEVINNVIKHSGADLCHIVLESSTSEVAISISDNGVGGVQMSNENGSSLGLFSVKARVEDMGGAMRVDSPIGQGTTISLSIPPS